MSNIRMLRRKEVETISGLSRSSIYSLMQAGEFPKQIKLSTKSVAWVESEILDWLSARIIEARGGVVS